MPTIKPWPEPIWPPLEAQAEPEADLEARRRDQAVEQLLNRVPAVQGQVLQRKFQYQFQQAPTDEEPDSLW